MNEIVELPKKETRINKLLLILVLLLVSCSVTKDFDETPTPIGGKERVRLVFHKSLGSAYYKVEGNTVRFSIQINTDGVIEKVSMSQRTENKYVDRTISFALKEHIKFTPATKNGQRVKANFEYDFTF